MLKLAASDAPKSGALRGQTWVVVIFANFLTQTDWLKYMQFESIYLSVADLARAAGVQDDFHNYRSR